MKKIVFLLFIISYCISAFGQEIVLTFTPVDESKTIDSIKITNVMTGESATVIGKSTVNLQAVLTSVNYIQDQDRKMAVYPNPFNESVRLEYSLKEEEEVNILLTNSLGQTVAAKKIELNSGTHRFKISTSCSGIYYVSVVTSEDMKSSKIISLSKGNNGNQIDYIGFQSSINLKKSSISESGELIHIELSSGKDKTIIADIPTESKTYEVKFYKCEDPDERNYRIVQIGEQWWMAENLAYLPNIYSPSEQSENEPRCYVYDYNGNTVSQAAETDNYKTYGVLYNWLAANQYCPDGWHLPSDEEWEEMTQFISNKKGPYSTIEWFEGFYWGSGNWYDVGKHLKSVGTIQNGNGLWTISETSQAINDFGFSGVPAGYLWYGGSFYALNDISNWWTSTKPYSTGAYYRQLYYNYDNFYREDSDGLHMGNSVRCVKD